MYIDTEGIILRHIKTVNNRRMILIFTKKYGKISAGTSISENGKNKSTLAMKPFTHGKYNMYKNGDYFNVTGAETIKSYYKIGENIDKYMYSSYVLEFTEKLLPENVAQPSLFNLLCDFLVEMEKRKKKYATLVVAYEIKAIKEMGYMPELDNCVHCGTKDDLIFFDVKNGGVTCKNCGTKIIARCNDSLIYEIGLGIIDILKYFIRNPLINLERLALDEKSLKILRKILNDYSKYHLDIGELKSEGFLSD